MKLNVFNGGQSSRLADYLIQPPEAVHMLNVDVRSGALAPINDLANSGGISCAEYPHYFEAESTWVSSATRREYVEYQDRLYYTQDGIEPKVYYGGTEYQIGLTPPSTKVTLTQHNSPASPGWVKATYYPLSNGFANQALGDFPDSTTLEYNFVVVKDSAELHSWQSSTVSGTAGGTNSVQVAMAYVPDGYSIEVYRKYSGVWRSVGSFASGAGLTLNDLTYDISANDSTTYELYTALRPSQEYSWRWISIDAEGRQSEERSGTLTTGTNGPGYYAVLEYTGGTGVKAYRLFDNRYLEVPSVDLVLDISSNTERPEYYGLDGYYFYVTTFYSSTTGLESSASPLTDDPGVQVRNGSISVSAIPVSSDVRVDKVRLYRVGGTSSEYHLITELANGTTTYSDTTADRDVSAEILVSENYTRPPSGLRYLTQAYEIMFGAVNDKLYFSEIGQPQYWPSANFIDFDQPITGIGEAANGVLVFTKHKTYIVTGTGPDTFVKYLVSGDQGCIDHRTIAQHKGSLLWVSTDGVCISSGSIPEVVSKPLLGKLQLSTRQAILYDEVYYLQLTTGYILCLDMRYGTAKFYYLNVDTTSLAKALDTLYGYSGGELLEMFAGGPTSFSYMSPRFIGDGYSNLKAYKDFYARLVGPVAIGIYIDDLLVYEKVFTSTATYDIIIPQDKQRGYSLQFMISGTGVVRELEWVELGRQNGR